MSALEQVLGGPAIEVVAKATRRRLAVLLAPDDVAGGAGAGRADRAPKKRGPARRVVDPRDKKRAGAGDQPVAEARRAG